MALERELAAFEARKPELLRHHGGQFAVIHGDELLGTYTTFNEAFEAGVRAVGNRPFLVKEIVDQEAQAQFPALLAGMISARPQ